MQGLLLIDKPVNWTSFDIVAKIRRIIADAENVKPSQVKVGHSGTLDPLASGLMLILIGKTYTRLAAEYTKLSKEYLVTLKLGAISPSGDQETTPVKFSDTRPSDDELSKVLKQFKGDMLQQPPDYSALKVNGQRAYKLARAGKTVKLEPRKVTIHSLELIKYSYPEVHFKVHVSSGTYIRSLAVDIGAKLNTGAYITNLRRTTIGDFGLKDSLETSDLSYAKIGENLFYI